MYLCICYCTLMLYNLLLLQLIAYQKRYCQIIPVQIPTTIAQVRNPSTLTSTNSFPKSLHILVDIFVSVTFYTKF